MEIQLEKEINIDTCTEIDKDIYIYVGGMFLPYRSPRPTHACGLAQETSTSMLSHLKLAHRM